MATFEKHTENPALINSAQEGHLEFLKAIWGRRGNCFWTKITIIPNQGKWDEEKFHEYVFEAKYTDLEGNEYSPEGDEAEVRHASKVGIWTAVLDKPSDPKIGRRNHHYGLTKNSNYIVKIDEWSFGNKAEIRFSVFDLQEEKNEQIHFALGCIPYFKEYGDDKTCKLDLILYGVKEGEMSPTFIKKDKILFELGDVPQIGADMELKLFDELKAFESRGNGNSIHPKQLFTLEALRFCLDKMNKDKELSIAYIGTDTTENLRSVIRTLNKEIGSKNLAKIKTLFVYHTHDWDVNLESMFGTQYKIKNLKGKGYEIKPIELPSDGSLPLMESVEITIATYVTPWAVEEENKKQYSKLLKGLMKDNINSRLITVDPVNSDVVIRSHIDEFNLDGFYINELKLVSEILPGAENHGVVDCIIWRCEDGNTI